MPANRLDRPPPRGTSSVAAAGAGRQHLLRWAAQVVLAAGLLAHAAALWAQPHSAEVDGYVLRSSVVQSTAIAASTAREHGIEPGPGTAVLNVVVLKKQGERRIPVASRVDAEIRTLLGSSHEVDLVEVRSNGRVSYLSPFPHAPAETLDFRISAQPLDGGPALELEFRERIGATGGRS